LNSLSLLGKLSLRRAFRVFSTFGGGVISYDSVTSDLILRPIKHGAATELNDRVVNALKDLHRLLELYAPSWYTEELHKKTAAALRAK
jgi:hypothetical protein